MTAAAGDDEVISTLLGAIPDEAKAGGIYSNADLKTRFEKVREICKKVRRHECSCLKVDVWDKYDSYHPGFWKR